MARPRCSHESCIGVRLDQFMMQHPDFANTDLNRLITAGVGGVPWAEAILRVWIDRGVSFIEALPRNATGKVLERTLLEQYVDASTPVIS